MIDCPIYGAGYSRDSGSLAAGANAEEFQLMGDVVEAVFFGDFGFHARIKAFVDFYNGSACFADQMVVMAVVSRGN